MKLFGFKTSMLAVLAVSLGACGLVPNLGSVPQPYQIDVGNLGYEVDSSGKITVPGVTVNLLAAPGAPDINAVRYVATIQTLDGSEAIPGNSVVRGLMFTHARGGYKCKTTPDDQCSINAQDSYFVASQTIVPNLANNSNIIQNIALTAGIWASGHIKAGSPAGWVVKFEYSGVTASGNAVNWSEIEQFTAPAKSGGTSGGGA